MHCSLPGFSVHGILQARIPVWAAHFLLQGIFLTQGLNPGHLHCRQISLSFEPLRKPYICMCVCVCVCVCVIICTWDTVLEVQSLGLNTDLQNEKIHRLGSIKYPLHGSCAFNSCLRFHDEL